MPSASLLHWRKDRMPRLQLVEVQCAASVAAMPPNTELIDENLRGYALLLSAHFQGFCRDLYSECAQVVVLKIRPALQVLIERQFAAQRKLDHGNPNVKNLRDDFERFGFKLDLTGADPTNSPRLAQLDELNRWRNVAAHHGTIPMGLPALSLLLLQGWRNSCDGLATSLDAIMYNAMRRILHRAPW